MPSPEAPPTPTGHSSGLGPLPPSAASLSAPADFPLRRKNDCPCLPVQAHSAAGHNRRIWALPGAAGPRRTAPSPAQPLVWLIVPTRLRPPRPAVHKEGGHLSSVPPPPTDKNAPCLDTLPGNRPDQPRKPGAAVAFAGGRRLEAPLGQAGSWLLCKPGPASRRAGPLQGSRQSPGGKKGVSHRRTHGQHSHRPGQSCRSSVGPQGSSRPHLRPGVRSGCCRLWPRASEGAWFPSELRCCLT